MAFYVAMSQQSQLVECSGPNALPGRHDRQGERRQLYLRLLDPDGCLTRLSQAGLKSRAHSATCARALELGNGRLGSRGC
jgi:hypothetical protein